MVLHHNRTPMVKYLKTADAEWYKQRITGVIVCALAAFVMLFIRLIYMQVIMGNEFRRLSLNNSIRLAEIQCYIFMPWIKRVEFPGNFRKVKK